MASSRRSVPGQYWLLFLHQLPAKRAYSRVKIWRALQAVGAVPLKNAAYVLPAGEKQRRDFERLLLEAKRGGGDGAICETRLVSGLRDDQLRSLFHAARDADYEGLIKELRAFGAEKHRAGKNPAAAMDKFRRRLAEIEEIDFFGASGRVMAEALMAELEHRAITKNKSARPAAAADQGSLTGRTWVTRQGIHVDRIACSWLIARFIDPKPVFKFVDGKAYDAQAGELRYDMQDGEFTHEGDKCSFEVLIERARIKDPALKAIAEIIHDIDLKDEKFGRPETAGIAHVIAGICRNQGEDEARMARGKELFDAAYEQFHRRGGI